MITTAIIVEYNPLHNGHIYHIKKAKEITNCDILIAVMSSYICQRGDIAIIPKNQRVQLALDYGVDIVIELPSILANQAADYFAQYAINYLKNFKVDYLFFGSETADITKLSTLNHQINPQYLKNNSLVKAFSLENGNISPNNILAYSYLKAIQATNIIPIALKRQNNFNSQKLTYPFASATAIRNNLHHPQILDFIPIKYQQLIPQLDSFYPILRHLLITKSNLNNIFLVSDGIENMLQKNAIKYSSYQDFISNSISKKYFKSKIQRILINILFDITQDLNFQEFNQVRILGLNTKAFSYLKNYSHQYIFKFKDLNPIRQKIELKIATILNQADDEIKYPIIKKSES